MGIVADLANELIGAAVTTRCDDSVAACSAGVLAQILRNVLGNAAKYRAPERTLMLEITAAKGEITIADNGIGMSAAATRHAFDPYFRADDAAPVAGHGLGLAIVRRTVEASGGTCDLQSQLGVGTTVTVRLPRHEAG